MKKIKIYIYEQSKYNRDGFKELFKNSEFSITFSPHYKDYSFAVNEAVKDDYDMFLVNDSTLCDSAESSDIRKRNPHTPVDELIEPSNGLKFARKLKQVKPNILNKNIIFYDVGSSVVCSDLAEKVRNIPGSKSIYMTMNALLNKTIRGKENIFYNDLNSKKERKEFIKFIKAA